MFLNVRYNSSINIVASSMAKSKEKFLARKLRKEGLSMKEISERLKVSKGSVSLWCSDIRLTKRQIQKLHDKMVRGSYEGRLKGTQMQKERKQRIIEECLTKAKIDIATLGEREMFVAGLGLYWGEGAKNSAVRFYNSDPQAIQFMMKWFRQILKIEENRFSLYLNINETHKDRLDDVMRFWSKLTGLKKEQFRKPILVKARNKKKYENFNNHYGTLCIRIAKSGNLLYQIMGWIKAMNEAG